jgi:membrane-associated phospholipid phosphatase
MPTRARHALLGAGFAVALLFVTWFLAFHVSAFASADQKVLSGFAGLNGPTVAPIARWIANLCSPKPFVFFAAVPVLVALLRRRGRVAVAVAALLLGANVTTQLLKPLLAHTRYGAVAGVPNIAGSWPSGHATAAMSLALAAVLAAPARARPYVAALGAAFAIAVSYSFLTLEWHYPSDVIGGFLVAATWALLAVAALLAYDQTPRPRFAPVARRLSIGEALAPPGLVLLGALALAGLVALARPHQVVAYARVHTAFMVGAPVIAALGLAVVTGVVLARR